MTTIKASLRQLKFRHKNDLGFGCSDMKLGASTAMLESQFRSFGIDIRLPLSIECAARMDARVTPVSEKVT
ncbi:MAG: hypothetical protein CO095_05945 [Armatimonadetes bacterium CG_4_9_14_3_um_filter_58_7]|nr:MAG: hypothetical protein CO095_05945 [Armatimonadetes bacterium CG_4_9_14_3_um_filter_58_7]